MASGGSKLFLTTSFTSTLFLGDSYFYAFILQPEDRSFCRTRHVVQERLDVRDTDLFLPLLFSFCPRMSVFDRLTSLIPQVSSSSRQTKERPSASSSPPPSLSSPVIRKKPIQIPSFAGTGRANIDTKQIKSGR